MTDQPRDITPDEDTEGHKWRMSFAAEEAEGDDTAGHAYKFRDAAEVSEDDTEGHRRPKPH